MLLTKLIVSSANRGLTNLVVQVIILITITRDIDTGHLIVLVFILPNTTLYINTFLAVLNASHYLRAIAVPFSGVECSLELSDFDLDMHQHGLDDQEQGDRPSAFPANDTSSRNTDQAEGSDRIDGENVV